MKNEPVHILRFGLIKCEIFQRQTGSGVFFNAKLSRMFRNGDQYMQSQLLGRDDLLAGAKLLDLAHTWVMLQGQAPAGRTADGRES